MKPHSGAVAACPFFERSVMHPYHLSSFRYRRLLAAVMTLPAMDTSTPVPHEFSGQWPCCFNGCAEAGRYVHASRPCMEPQSAMVLELVDAALQKAPSKQQYSRPCSVYATWSHSCKARASRMQPVGRSGGIRQMRKRLCTVHRIRSQTRSMLCCGTWTACVVMCLGC